MLGLQQVEIETLIERLPFGAGVQIDVRQVQFPGFLNQRLHDLARQALVTKFRPGQNVDDTAIFPLRRCGLPHNVDHLQKSSRALTNKGMSFGEAGRITRVISEVILVEGFVAVDEIRAGLPALAFPKSVTLMVASKNQHARPIDPFRP